MRVQEVGGRRRPQQPAAVEHDDVVADPLQLAEQVRGDQHRDPELACRSAHQRQHVVARGRVEPVGRLVEQHQPRVVHERLGELRPLLHAGGVAAHRAVALLGQARRGAARRRRARGPRRTAARTSGPCARPGRSPTRRRAGSRARACSRPARGSRAPSVATSWPSTLRRAAGGRHQAEQDLDQRRLAGAVGADQPGDALTDVTSSWSSAVTGGTASSARRSR